MKIDTVEHCNYETRSSSKNFHYYHIITTESEGQSSFMNNNNIMELDQVSWIVNEIM